MKPFVRPFTRTRTIEVDVSKEKDDMTPEERKAFDEIAKKNKPEFNQREERQKEIKDWQEKRHKEGH